MTNDDPPQAVKDLQGGLSEQGLIRFEVVGLEQDRDLIRLLARRLSVEGDGATSLRLVLNSAISCDCTKKGNILAAFRNSPLVGAESDIDFARPVVRGRKVKF
jgi:hypothetical protein